MNKNKLRKVIILGTFFLGMSLVVPNSEAGVRVHVRFAPPKVKRVTVIKPAKPYHRAVWMKGHWKVVKGRYVYVKGRWVRARSGYVYVQPCWVKTARGYYFVPGHWVKK